MAKFIEELPEVRDAVEEVVTEEVTDLSTGDDDAGRQPREAEQGKKDNLDDNPSFRKWKSEQDKRHAALQSALAQAERKQKEDAARLAQYEQTLDTLATKDLDDTGKLAYENRKLKQAIAMIEQEKQITEGRQRVFNRIRQKAGMPIPDEVFDEATDADHAWELAVDYMLQRNTPQQKQAAKAEKKEANQVYLGSTSTTTDDWEAKAARLLKNKDAIGYARHVLERKE